MKIALPPQAVEVRHKLPALKALTAIRFFAALYVVLYHESHSPTHIVFFPLAARIINSGYTAVTLFFVLSGFILAYNYEQVRSRKEFWISRFARIYPVYLLSLLPPLLITPHWSYHPRPGTVGVVLTVLLLQGWWPPLCFSLNMAAWTLSVEAFFYAVFPFLLPWTQRLRRSSFAGIQAAYFALLCLCPLLSLSATAAPAGLQLSRWLESSFPLARLNAFFVGVYAGVHFRRSATRRMSGVAESLSSRGRAWGITLTAAAILGLLLASPSESFGPLRSGFLQLFYAGLIWLLGDVQWAVLNNHAMQMAGEISYSMYILQFPVMFASDDLVGRLFPRAGHISGLYICVLIGLSYVVFRWFEIPARLAIREKLSGRPVPLRAI
jgi:peptidoglycan/LPS O-acetylase OafA/YrhL